MLICLWTAVKFYEDENIPDNELAKKIGFKNTEELMQLQLELLKLIDFRVYISCEEFDKFKNIMLRLVKTFLTRLITI